MLRNWWRKCRQKRAERRFWRLVLWQLADEVSISNSAVRTLFITSVLIAFFGFFSLVIGVPFDMVLAGMSVAGIYNYLANFRRELRAEDQLMSELVTNSDGKKSAVYRISIVGYALHLSSAGVVLVRVPVDGDNPRWLKRLPVALEQIAHRNLLAVTAFCKEFGYVFELSSGPNTVANIHKPDRDQEWPDQVGLLSPLGEQRLERMRQHELKERLWLAKAKQRQERLAPQCEWAKHRTQQLKESWPALIVRGLGYLLTWLWQQSPVCQWLKAQTDRRQKAEVKRLADLQGAAQAVLAGEELAGEAAISRLKGTDDLVPNAAGISPARLLGTELLEAPDSA